MNARPFAPLAVFGFVFLALLVPVAGRAQDMIELEADLDPFVSLPGAYGLTPDKLEEMFADERFDDGEQRSPYYAWLTKDRTRALFKKQPFGNVRIDMTMFEGEVPIEEAIVDFKNGEFLGVTVSIFNRGDGGEIGPDDFDKRWKAAGRVMNEQLDIRPRKKKAKPTQGLLTEGYTWISARGMAVLEWNPEAPGKVEFLRLRLAKRDAEGAYAAAMEERAGATVTLSELPERVERDGEGNVYVRDLPMVDQGAKGYCVVASAQRLFEYYGIACDMHQLAQIAGSDPERGTSPITVNEELGSIAHLFKTRFETLAVGHEGQLVELEKDRYVGDEVEERKFQGYIRKHVDEGIPLLWSLELGRYEEEPPIAQQGAGGHMRMIIGYNDESERIIFSDSWGMGHEFKTIDAHDCYLATRGLFLLKPTIR